MKVGIGQHNDDSDVNLSSRGIIHALSVEIVDANGNQITSFGGTNMTIDSSQLNTGDHIATEEKQDEIIDLLGLSAGLGVPEHDYRSLSYDGSGNLTSVVYKRGGSGGATVATLTLSYSGGNLSSIART